MKKFPNLPVTAKALRLWQVSFLFFLFSNVLHAQTWSPPGAIWHYNYFNVGFYGYSEIKYTGDTVISSITCKKLDKSMHIIDYINQFHHDYIGTEYTYEQNGVVFLYYNNHFDTLFNFNASVGETWRMAGQPWASYCDSNSIITVLDTGTLVINSTPLRFKKVLFNYGSFGNFPDTIIEKIGPINWYMLPYDMCLGIDGNRGGPLRCYTDSNFATYQHHYSNNCDFIVGENEIDVSADLISVYPNPASSGFTLYSHYGGFRSIEIYSSLGEKIFSQEHTAHGQQQKIDIDTHSWSVGVYFVRIKTESGIVVKKLVKQ